MRRNMTAQARALTKFLRRKNGNSFANEPAAAFGRLSEKRLSASRRAQRRAKRAHSSERVKVHAELNAIRRTYGAAA